MIQSCCHLCPFGLACERMVWSDDVDAGWGIMYCILFLYLYALCGQFCSFSLGTTSPLLGPSSAVLHCSTRAQHKLSLVLDCPWYLLNISMQLLLPLSPKGHNESNNSAVVTRITKFCFGWKLGIIPTHLPLEKQINGYFQPVYMTKRFKKQWRCAKEITEFIKLNMHIRHLNFELPYQRVGKHLCSKNCTENTLLTQIYSTNANENILQSIQTSSTGQNFRKSYSCEVQTGVKILGFLIQNAIKCMPIVCKNRNTKQKTLY